MTTQSNGTNPNQSNQQLANEYLEKMKKDLAIAKTLIAELDKLAGQEPQLKLFIAMLKSEGIFAPPGALKNAENQLKAVEAQIKAVGGKLESLVPGVTSLDNAIAALEAGIYSTVGGRNFGEDMAMFASFMDKLVEAAIYKQEVEAYRKKMGEDGNNNKDLLKDALAMMKASSAEDGVLMNLQAEISKDLETLNKQEADAKADLSKYHWYNSWLHEGTIGHDHETIRNAEAMKKILLEIMTDIGPEIANAQNSIFETASLALNQIEKRIKALLMDMKLNPEQKLKQVKVLMALALGILSQVQTDVAKEKSEDTQTEMKSATYSTQMNIDNQKSAMIQLERELKYAKAMGVLMKIVKPIMDVAMVILAAVTAGPGGAAVMFAIAADDIYSTESGKSGAIESLTNKLAKAIGGKHGELFASLIIGAAEVGVTIGGGMAFDKAIKMVAVSAAGAAVEEATAGATAAISAMVETLEQDAVANSAQEITRVATSAARQAAESGAMKAVMRLSASDFISLVMKGADSTAFQTVQAAANSAAKIAVNDVGYLAEIAAKGGAVSAEEIALVANRAANEGAASATNSTAGKVASGTEKSGLRAGAERGLSAALYASLKNGGLTAIIKQIMKDNGDSDKSIETVMEIMKIIEQIMASMALMYGAGMFSSMNLTNAGTALFKASNYATLAGTAASGVASYGIGQSEMGQASAIEAINEGSVSNDMLHMFMKQFNEQGDIDRKHAQNMFADQASNYTLASHLEDNWKELAKVMETQAV